MEGNNYPVNGIMYTSFQEVHCEAWWASTVQHCQVCLCSQGLIQESITFPFSSIFFFWTLTKASACLPWHFGLLHGFSDCPSCFTMQTVVDFHCWLCQNLFTLKCMAFSVPLAISVSLEAANIYSLPGLLFFSEINNWPPASFQASF